VSNVPDAVVTPESVREVANEIIGASCWVGCTEGRNVDGFTEGGRLVFGAAVEGLMVGYPLIDGCFEGETVANGMRVGERYVGPAEGLRERWAKVLGAIDNVGMALGRSVGERVVGHRVGLMDGTGVGDKE
jgi:hypothetical protein